MRKPHPREENYSEDVTIALWLFDEPDYPNMTLTDASVNQLDLRLKTGGELAAGKYGNALKILGNGKPPAEYSLLRRKEYIGELPEDLKSEEVMGESNHYEWSAN